MFLLVFK